MCSFKFPLISCMELLINIITFSCVLSVTKASVYTRDIRFDTISTSDYAIMEMSLTSRPFCAGLCNINTKCAAFIHNHLDGRCQLFSRLSGTSQGKKTKSGDSIYRNTRVCKAPSNISKGRLLSVDGQVEGSTALFMCDDFHFTNITHGVCRADGVWEGLDKPCVHLAQPPYILRSNNRISKGKCVSVQLQAASDTEIWPRIDFNSTHTGNTIFHCNFRLSRKRIVRNTYVNGHWGDEERDIPFWPLKVGKEANLTYCVEESRFRVFIDGEEMFTYKHRLPVKQINIIDIQYCIVRRITFTD